MPILVLTCDADGCDNPVHAQGLCHLHYRRELHQRRKTHLCKCGCGELCRYDFVYNHAIRLVSSAEQARRARNSGESRRGTGTKGYIKLHGRHEHRVVAEKKIGRTLQRWEIVHHKDHDKHNNDPLNLEAMTQTEHARLHLLERHHGN
jgi:hypothetical protein